MIEQLFGSKTRVKLLQLFYGNPNRAFYVREITRKIDEQINSVRRELANLLSIGLIKSETNNNRLYYEVNQEYDHYASLSDIFGGGAAGTSTTKKTATVTTEAPAKETDDVKAIKTLGNVEIALYSGQFTRDPIVSVDFMVVGDINQTKLNKFIEELEAKEGKEIRYTSMTVKEFEYRRQVNDRFLATVLEAKKQILIDKHNHLTPKEGGKK